MSTPSFEQHQPRSLLMPALGAAILLVAAFFLARHFFPATSVDMAYVHTDVLPTTSIFKADSIVIAPRETNHTTFIASTIKVDNHLQNQIFLDDFILTLTDANGAQLVVKAVQKQDLTDLQVEFPKLKPMVAAPLLRESSIDPDKSAQGTIVFSLPLPQSIWDTRKSAVIEVDIYHGHPSFIDVPK